MKKEEVLRSISEKLKSSRESKALTIDQAHIKTRIHLNVLKALEDGSIDEAISFPYAKGFLKKYSDFLGANTSEIMGEYLSLHKGSHAAPVPIPKVIPKEKIRPQGSPRVYRYLVIATAIIIVLSLVSHLKHGRAGGAKIVPSQKSAAKMTPAAQTAARQKIKKAVKIEPVSPQIKVPAAQSFSIPKGEPIIVTLKVKRKVMVQASKDGNLLFWQSLWDGAQETVKAKDKVNLSIANVEALEITVNGKPLFIPRKGAIKDLEITRSGFKIK